MVSTRPCCSAVMSEWTVIEMTWKNIWDKQISEQVTPALHWTPSMCQVCVHVACCKACCIVSGCRTHVPSFFRRRVMASIKMISITKLPEFKQHCPLERTSCHNAQWRMVGWPCLLLFSCFYEAQAKLFSSTDATSSKKTLCARRACKHTDLFSSSPLHMFLHVLSKLACFSDILAVPAHLNLHAFPGP